MSHPDATDGVQGWFSSMFSGMQKSTKDRAAVLTYDSPALEKPFLSAHPKKSLGCVYTRTQNTKKSSVCPSPHELMLGHAWGVGRKKALRAVRCWQDSRDGKNKTPPQLSRFCVSTLHCAQQEQKSKGLPFTMQVYALNPVTVFNL